MVSVKTISDDVQVIEKEGQPEWVVIPYAVYNRMLVELEAIRLSSPVESLDFEYDETQDSAIALLQGPTDLSERHEEILREEVQSYSGWTQKDAVQ